MFERYAPGVFVVRYHAREDLDPQRQAPLVGAMREAAREGRVGVVFNVGTAIHFVDVAVPTFWLQTTSDPSMRLGAMAIVTSSIAVEIAVTGFAAANAIRRTGLAVRTFSTEGSALEWVCDLLGAAPGLAAT